MNETEQLVQPNHTEFTNVCDRIKQDVNEKLVKHYVSSASYQQLIEAGVVRRMNISPDKLKDNDICLINLSGFQDVLATSIVVHCCDVFDKTMQDLNDLVVPNNTTSEEPHCQYVELLENYKEIGYLKEQQKYKDEEITILKEEVKRLNKGFNVDAVGLTAILFIILVMFIVIGHIVFH